MASNSFKGDFDYVLVILKAKSLLDREYRDCCGSVIFLMDSTKQPFHVHRCLKTCSQSEIGNCYEITPINGRNQKFIFYIQEGGQIISDQEDDEYKPVSKCIFKFPQYFAKESGTEENDDQKSTSSSPVNPKKRKLPAKKKPTELSLDQQKMSKSLICPLTRSPFRNPRVLTCGHTFDLYELNQWIQSSKPNKNYFPCPACKTNVSQHHKIIPWTFLPILGLEAKHVTEQKPEFNLQEFIEQEKQKHFETTVASEKRDLESEIVSNIQRKKFSFHYTFENVSTMDYFKKEHPYIKFTHTSTSYERDSDDDDDDDDEDETLKECVKCLITLG